MLYFLGKILIGILAALIVYWIIMKIIFFLSDLLKTLPPGLQGFLNWVANVRIFSNGEGTQTPRPLPGNTSTMEVMVGEMQSRIENLGSSLQQVQTQVHKSIVEDAKDDKIVETKIQRLQEDVEALKRMFVTLQNESKKKAELKPGGTISTSKSASRPNISNSAPNFAFDQAPIKEEKTIVNPLSQTADFSNGQYKTSTSQAERQATAPQGKGTFYAPPPKNEIFYHSKLKAREIDNSFYIVNINDSGEATYQLNPSQVFVDKAINMPDYFILPAVEVASGDLYNASKFETISPGTLKREDNYWRITRKSVIKVS